MSLIDRAHDLTAPQRRLRANVRNLTLWTCQGWLTMILVAAGYAKIAEPMTSLELLLGWANPQEEVFVRSLGWFEIGLGLTPLATLFLGTAGRGLLLSGLAAISTTAAVMVVVHSLRMEITAVVFNVFILALSLVAFRGRLRNGSSI